MKESHWRPLISDSHTAWSWGCSWEESECDTDEQLSLSSKEKCEVHQSRLLKKKKFICLGQVLVAIYEMFFAACRVFSCDMQGLVPWPGIKPGPPALGAQNLSHWTTKEVHQPRLPADEGARPREPLSHHWFLFLSHSICSPPTDLRSVIKIYPKSDPDHLLSQHPGPKL